MAIGDTQKAKQNDLEINSPAMTDESDYTSLFTVSEYTFMSDAFDGLGGFRNGHYLVPHTAEMRMSFDRRRDLAYYKNYVYPIIRATIDPVFNASIKRSVLVAGDVVSEGYYATGFVADATGGGEDLQAFVDRVVTKTTLHGAAFVVMDNTPEAASEKNKTVALDRRLYPYVFIRTMEELDSSRTGYMGQLEWIRFCDGTSEDGKERLYVYYDSQVIRREKKVNDEYVVISETPHGLGVIPVIVSYYDSRESKSRTRIEVDPPFYDIARINHAVYNKDSLITSQERSQGFAMAYLQEDKPGNVVFGRHTYLSLPMKTTMAPGYIAPPPAILGQLVADNEKLREDLFRIAGQKGIDFRSGQAKSGDALEWEFIAQEVVLKKTAKRAATVEQQIMDLFAKWTNEAFEFQVEYPEEYRPASDDSEIARFDKLMMMIDDKPAVRTYIQKQAFMVAAKKWPEDEVAALMSEFDAPLREEKEKPEEPEEVVKPDSED